MKKLLGFDFLDRLILRLIESQRLQKGIPLLNVSDETLEWNKMAEEYSVQLDIGKLPQMSDEWMSKMREESHQGNAVALEIATREREEYRTQRENNQLTF